MTGNRLEPRVVVWNWGESGMGAWDRGVGVVLHPCLNRSVPPAGRPQVSNRTCARLPKAAFVHADMESNMSLGFKGRLSSHSVGGKEDERAYLRTLRVFGLRGRAGHRRRPQPPQC
jgi:hypothetical protein